MTVNNYTNTLVGSTQWPDCIPVIREASGRWKTEAIIFAYLKCGMLLKPAAIMLGCTAGTVSRHLEKAGVSKVLDWYRYLLQIKVFAPSHIPWILDITRGLGRKRKHPARFRKRCCLAICSAALCNKGGDRNEAAKSLGITTQMFKRIYGY
jgi:hypothetical protein